MKKIALFLSALAMLVACEKEEGGIQQNTKVTIGVNHEQVTDGVGRVAISENGNKFALNWENTDKLSITTSTNNAYKSFALTNYEGNSAQFEGELPDAGSDVTTTNYLAAVSSFISRSITQGGRNQIRLAVATNQIYNAANIGNACMLVGEQADCAVGVIPGDFSLKTMNAFIKIPVTKGSVAAGSSNTYTNGMKLQSVKIEAIGEEQLAGRFGIDLTADDWSTAYATDTGINDSDKSSSITLNCNNLALTNEATNLYVAVAFGTYSQGLKVTFTVVGDNDKTGEMVRTIGGSGITIARNTMLSMPPVAVTPTDIATEKYQLISSVEELSAGTYYMAGKINNVYYLATGSLTTGSNYDLITTTGSSYSAVTESIDVTDAAEIKIEVKDATNNQYYVKIGEKYLTTTSALANRKLILQDATTPNPYWTFANDSNRGGIILESSVVQVYLVTASGTTSNVMRTYKSDNEGTDKGSCGVYFFKKL